MSDLIHRLRSAASGQSPAPKEDIKALMMEAASAIEALCHQIERVEAHDAMVVKALVDLYGEAMLDTSTQSFKQAMFGALNAIQQSKWPYPMQVTAS